MKNSELDNLELSAYIDHKLEDKSFTVVSKGKKIFPDKSNIKHIESDKPGGYILIRWNE